MYNFFSPLQITPRGWLRDQLMIQAEGLAGNLDKMWPDVRDSAWIGGDREGWERVPYWLDGFIPLAFLLRDEDRIARAEKYIASILDRQQKDGWICPCTMEERPSYDPWSLLLIGKVLAMYCEFTKDIPEKKALWKKTDKGLYKAMECLYRLMEDGTIKLFNWGKFRWFEGLIPLQYLAGRYRSPWIVQLGRLLQEQGAEEDVCDGVEQDREREQQEPAEHEIEDRGDDAGDQQDQADDRGRGGNRSDGRGDAHESGGDQQQADDRQEDLECSFHDRSLPFRSSFIAILP